MIISLIAALDENRVIGYKNTIPWHIKDDLIRFKNKTVGHTVIMGRTTFDSLLGYYKKSGRPLPDRRHIIVSREVGYIVAVPNCFVANSIDTAIQLAIEKEKAALHTSEVCKASENGQGRGEAEIFISGGASLFKQTIDRADRLYLTIVHGKYEGDTYFPEYSQFTKVIGKEDKKTKDGLEYTFLDLAR